MHVDLLNDILNWHIETFPNATKTSQVFKVEEEMLELRKANSEKERKEELADIYISSFCLYARFKSIIGECIFNMCQPAESDVLEKFEKLKKRKWEYDPALKTYHHI